MTVHEKVTELLALSAAGLLSPDEERIVKSHISECAECAASAHEFAQLSTALVRLPAPPTPPFLAARTEVRLAAAAERRESTWLAVLAAVIAWGMSGASWILYRTFAPAAALGWMAWFFVLPLLTVPATAMLIRRARLERSLL
jgi:anti-sigma factor RsiW